MNICFFTLNRKVNAKIMIRMLYIPKSYENIIFPLLRCFISWVQQIIFLTNKPFWFCYPQSLKGKWQIIRNSPTGKLCNPKPIIILDFMLCKQENEFDGKLKSLISKMTHYFLNTNEILWKIYQQQYKTTKVIHTLDKHAHFRQKKTNIICRYV